MSWAKIPLISFNTYLLRQGDDLFKGVREVIAAIPDNNYLDADVLIDHILVEAGEFPVTFTDPWFYQGAVTNWAKRQAWAWGKMVKALSVEYDPLENYDRREDWTDHNEHEDHDTAHSHTVSDSTTKANGNVTDGVSGFNTNGFRNSDHSDTESTARVDNNGTADQSGDTAGKYETRHSGRVHGNIGVTTSQQMLISELELAQWNIYNTITDSFISELVKCIYI